MFAAAREDVWCKTANSGTALATSIEIKSSFFLRKREDGATNDGQAEQD